MNHETRKNIKDGVIIIGGFLGTVALCVSGAALIGDYIRNNNSKVEAYDTRRTPDEDAVCTVLDFDAGQTVSAITDRFPHYNKSSDKSDRAYAIIGITGDAALTESVSVSYCTGEARIITDPEAGTSLPGFNWDLYPTDLAADYDQVSVAQFTALLDTNR